MSKHILFVFAHSTARLTYMFPSLRNQTVVARMCMFLLLRTHMDVKLPTIFFFFFFLMTTVKYRSVTHFHIMAEEINIDYELHKCSLTFSFH